LRDAFNFDGSRPNLTLIEVTREHLRMSWKGPLVLYSTQGSAHSNITLSDFRTLLDFCKVYESSSGALAQFLMTNNLMEVEVTNPSLFNDLLLHSSGNRTFTGVEIACEGDKQYLNTEQFMAVDVPVVHPIFDNVNADNGYIVGYGVTKVSKLINLPCSFDASSLTSGGITSSFATPKKTTAILPPLILP